MAPFPFSLFPGVTDAQYVICPIDTSMLIAFQ